MQPQAVDSQSNGATKPSRLRLSYFLPLLIFGVLGVAFAVGLTMNPRELPSTLIGKEAPQFDLPPVKGRELGLKTEDLKGQVSIVNVFASWCTECRREHPLFMRISREGTVPLFGLNYKDQPDDAANWLDTLGDPYTRTGADLNGRVAIDWGVYGVPETFIVDSDGRIVHKHIGATTEEVWQNEMLPIIKELQAKEQQAKAAS